MIFFAWFDILSSVEMVFEVLARIASWMSQRDKSNKQPKQALINSWLQHALPFYNSTRLSMIFSLMQFYQTLKGHSSNEVKHAR